MSASNFVFYIHNIFYKITANVKPSLWIALLVFCLHCVVIFLLLNERTAAKSQTRDALIKFRLLQPDLPAQIQPAINLYFPSKVVSPAIEMKLPDVVLIDAVGVNKDFNKSAELHNKNSPTIFDPRLRKKLSEVQANMPEPDSDLKTWVDSSGAQFVEINEGKCIKSMSGTSTGDHAINWSLPFKCRKNESERMMDNINRELITRKKVK